jgi:hypothetical protein
VRHVVVARRHDGLEIVSTNTGLAVLHRGELGAGRFGSVELAVEEADVTVPTAADDDRDPSPIGPDPTRFRPLRTPILRGR